MANPTGIGGFKPGQTGNPGGRPKSALAAELAKAHTEKAVLTLAEILGNEEADQRARIAAAQALLDRAWGKPAQSIEMDAKVGVYGLTDVLSGISKGDDQAVAG